jgi:hypothetical protein
MQETNMQNSYLQDIDNGVIETYEPEAMMPEADAFDIMLICKQLFAFQK